MKVHRSDYSLPHLRRVFKSWSSLAPFQTPLAFFSPSISDASVSRGYLPPRKFCISIINLTNFGFSAVQLLADVEIPCCFKISASTTTQSTRGFLETSALGDAISFSTAAAAIRLVSTVYARRDSGGCRSKYFNFFLCRSRLIASPLESSRPAGASPIALASFRVVVAHCIRIGITAERRMVLLFSESLNARRKWEFAF